MIKKIGVIIGCVALIFGCKTKQTVSTEVPFEPTRDDYAMAASYAYIVMIDSVSKKTARLIKDSAFSLRFKKDEVAKFSLNEQLNKEGYNRAMKYQINDLLAIEIEKLAITASPFLHLGKNDFPENYLRYNHLVRFIIEPNEDSLTRHVAREMAKSWEMNYGNKLWTEVNILYNQYYSKDATVAIDFYNISKQGIDLFSSLASRQEPMLKDSFMNWENKDALRIMEYVRR